MMGVIIIISWSLVTNDQLMIISVIISHYH